MIFLLSYSIWTCRVDIDLYNLLLLHDFISQTKHIQSHTILFLLLKFCSFNSRDEESFSTSFSLIISYFLNKKGNALVTLTCKIDINQRSPPSLPFSPTNLISEAYVKLHSMIFVWLKLAIMSTLADIYVLSLSLNAMMSTNTNMWLQMPVHKNIGAAQQIIFLTRFSYIQKPNKQREMKKILGANNVRNANC